MIASAGKVNASSLVLLLCVVGCDRAAEREAEEEALRQRPPVSGGNITQAMSAERVTPKLPTLEDRLLRAIRDGNRDGVERWLAEGEKLGSGAPLLVAAVRGEGDLAFVQWLTDEGAALNVSDAAGRTPLSWAAGQGSGAEVAFLLKRGADASRADQLGRTPLHFAVFSGDPNVVTLLLDASADVNAQDSLGTTPLMYACAKNEADIVRTLRERGADDTLKDKLGRTAAERAHGEPNPCTVP